MHAVSKTCAISSRAAPTTHFPPRIAYHWPRAARNAAAASYLHPRRPTTTPKTKNKCCRKIEKGCINMLLPSHSMFRTPCHSECVNTIHMYMRMFLFAKCVFAHLSWHRQRHCAGTFQARQHTRSHVLHKIKYKISEYIAICKRSRSLSTHSVL